MSSAIALIIIGVAVLFIIGIKLLSSPKTARMGNLVAAAGMGIALAALHKPGGEYVWSQGWNFNYTLIVIGTVIGLVIGVAGAYSVKMTAMPQMVALFNGLGGGAAALVAGLEFLKGAGGLPVFVTGAMLFATLIGSLSFSGSIIAYLKLQGKFEKPLTFPGQNILNGLMLAVILGLCGWLTFAVSGGSTMIAFDVMFPLALCFGVAMVMPIGGADMPVVISLLNSFTGLAVAADGFAIHNLAMVVAGTLVGSSGTLLTWLMCQAMNRPITNVLFGAFGTGGGGGGGAQAGGLDGKTVRSIQADEAALLLSHAQQVVIIPGYGMAVAQAQHQVRELSDELGRRGVEVSFAIHPVAGRMPGHMNVLLAEANVPYDQLCEMEAINPTMKRVDVCLVIGANDVVNPAAREEKSSPIYGMPIIEADHAKAVIVLKRSMAAGFAGIENHLFYKDNTRMLFGDAKASLNLLVAQVKAG
jgi:H+-translocating NAD(P) transhydrogenase subunit beta